MNHYIETTTLLERLVDWRESVHRFGPEHFNMSSWGYTQTGLVVDDECGDLVCDLGLADVHALDINACGTTACAAGHFVSLARLTASEVPERFNGEVEPYLLSVLDVPGWLFERYSWNMIELGDTTMDERCNAYETEHGDESVAEWLTVLDYLDQRIKAEMAGES